MEPPTTTTTTTRRPYFLQDTTGLASISDIEHDIEHGFSRPLYSPRKANPSSFSSPRSVRSNSRLEDQPYFLDSCFLCKKLLGQNRDIFMYRGDTPFCSEECRAEQIDIDESKEKTRHLSSSMRALRKKEQNENSTNKTSRKYSFRSGTVAAA